MTKKIYLDEGKLKRMHGMGATSGEMANYFGCSRETVGRRLRKLGIHTSRLGKRIPELGVGERLDNRDGFVEVLQPDHPRANAEGYVRRSILIWEMYHGKPFPEDRVPHHMDGDPTNDSPGNVLSLLPSEHSMLHIRAQARDKRGRLTKKNM
jgi:hypothetical protein